MSQQQEDPAQASENQPNKESLHQAKTQKIPPTSGPDEETAVTSEYQTRPTAPYSAAEAGGPLPELDEGPPPKPVDDIQEAIFEAGQQGVSTEVDFEQLPKPGLGPKDKPASETAGEIRHALAEGTQQGLSTQASFDDLPEPAPDLDEGPPPKPVDDIQEAIFEARQQGVSPEVIFDALPEPDSGPKKKITRRTKPVASTGPDHSPETAATEAAPSQPATIISEFWLIFSLFLTFRLLTLFLLRPGGFIRDWSDFDTYLGIASLSDYSLYPFLDFWLEWPPLAPWLAVGVYRLSLLFPPWADDPRLWFILILGSIFLLFELGNFVLIHRLSCRLFQEETVRRVLWLYAGLFPPVYTMLGFFDGVALFFILLGLELLLQDRRFPSAIALGVGFLVKIIPALMLPVAARWLWQRYQSKPREASIEIGLYGVVFGLTIILLLAPFLIAGPQWVLASARAIVGRSSWETIWAVIEGYYGFGVVLGERLNPNETVFAVHPSHLPGWFWPLITLAFAGIYASLFIRKSDYEQPRNIVAFSGLTIAIFLLYSKGYSPQFLVYLLPFIILLFPNARGLTYALILTGLNVLEQPIYFILLPNAAWLLIFIVIFRFVLTIILAVEFALVLWPATAWAMRAATLRPRVPLFLGSLSALILLLLTPLMLRAYTNHRLENSPVGTFAGFMAALGQNPTDLGNCDISPESQRIFLSNQATYRQIYPYLNGDFELQLTTGAPEQSDFPAPAEFLPDADLGWVLATGPQAQRLRNAASQRGRTLGAFTFEGLGTASLHDFSNNSNARPCLPLARFTNANIELLTHQVDALSGRIEVNLYWRARTPQSQNLTVFTQILNSQGQQVAGHDSAPRNGEAPIPSWPAEAIQIDSHHIQLPPNLPPGEYRIIAGLYNDPGQRLRAIGPDGFNYANQAVPLGTVRLP